MQTTLTITKGEILAMLHQLPPMPAVVQEVIASFRNTEPDSAVLADKIAQDQGLSAKVLRLANSPFYGLPRRVGSIQDAIMVLGLGNVRSLSLSAGVAQVFPAVSHGLFDREAYWLRSFRVATFSGALAKSFRLDQQIAFTSGMFHDIGQLVLDLCIPEQFADLLEQQKISGADLIETERSVFGFDHAEIGAEIIRRWNFPQNIEETVRHWRDLEHEPFNPLAGVVHVAVLLEGGLTGGDLMARLPAALCDRMGIGWERIEACMPQPEQIEAGADLMRAA